MSFLQSISSFALVVVTIAVSLAPLAAAHAAPATPAATPVIVVLRDDAAPARGTFHPDDRAAANPDAWGYLERGVAASVQALEAAHGFRATHVYSHAIRGFAARLTPAQVKAVEQDPDVAFVETDGPVQIVVQSLPWGVDRVEADLSTTLAGDGSGAVSGVNIYIIDTGIDTAHTDLSVVRHVNFAGGKNADCNGHGTHVAGTAAAKDNASAVVGVAPGAPLTGVKVLGCNGSGYMSAVIKGVDWVTANAVKPAVANMSLGGGASTALDDALTRSAASGVFYVVAAGNEGADACAFSPARAATGANGIVAVGATDAENQAASWSNWGPCVDAWAPGVSIRSTRRGGGTTTMSGTSMAAPHVAGVAALYLQSQPAADPTTVETTLQTDALSPGTVSQDGAPITIVNATRY